MLCGRQNLALQTHREDECSKNPGNCKALIDFRVDGGDEVLKNHLATAPNMPMYCSNTIQNEIISLIGHHIQKRILLDIHNGSSKQGTVQIKSKCP